MVFKQNFYKLFFIFTLTVFSLSALSGYAQNIEELLDGYEDKYYRYDEGVGTEKLDLLSEDQQARGVSSYFYEVPNIKALSHMFWAVGLYDEKDNWAVDEFMRINECEMYQRYSGDEIEWVGIREAAREFINGNKAEFPTRFEFVIPIMLKDYSTKYSAFELQPDSQIKSYRRFELFATDIYTPPCTKDFRVVDGYPRALVMEFSRPFTMTRVPMSQDVANEYIKKRNDEYHARYTDVSTRSKYAMYTYRDAYLHIKIKVFAHGKHLPPNAYGVPTVQMMGILEGYAVYGELGKKNLFMSQTFIRDKKRGKLNKKLNTEYEALREKSQSGGMLH